ncbi:hypothetical protein JHK86_012232 [Glycine max]|nr:hypothetical protein JHK86_012232 [Glycine max]
MDLRWNQYTGDVRGFSGGGNMAGLFSYISRPSPFLFCLFGFFLLLNYSGFLLYFFIFYLVFLALHFEPPFDLGCSGRAPSTAEEFERVAEEKAKEARKGVASQSLGKKPQVGTTAKSTRRAMQTTHA